MYRAIVEVTVKLALDIDIETIADVDYSGEEKTQADRVQAGIDEFYEGTMYQFFDTDNVTVVSQYSELRDIQKVSK